MYYHKQAPGAGKYTLSHCPELCVDHLCGSDQPLLFVCCFETRSLYTMLTSNLCWSSCLSLLIARITGMCHHAWHLKTKPKIPFIIICVCVNMSTHMGIFFGVGSHFTFTWVPRIEVRPSSAASTSPAKPFLLACLSFLFFPLSWFCPL